MPPNTPTKRHKLRRRRLDPGCQPPIRTLLGAALCLHRDIHKDLLHDEEEEEKEEEEEEEDEEVRVVVGSYGGVDKTMDGQSCSRRRGKPEGGAGMCREHSVVVVVV